MKIFKITVIILLSAVGIAKLYAQTTSASNNLVAQPIPDRTVLFSVSDSGVSKPITWGLDLAWLSETNVRRGIAFMGIDRVDVVRSSFTPTDSLINGDLKTAELATLNQRLAIIDLLGPNTTVMLNDDDPSVATWYTGNAAHWAQLIDVTTRRVQDHGRKVISVAPFNEPDNPYAPKQGTTTDFYNVAGELRKNTRFDSMRICGGNTLNTDQALVWYNPLKSRLDEGNTHQLAGSFDNYANFYKTVRTNGDHGTNDELHNVMEAMVGVEYGMQTGIWWGTAELARGEFVKASDGKRLGYAEHRPNWTSASVYRNLDGKVQAFGGTSERQSVTTTYRFVSKDRDVYYDGYGPQREYTMVLPGGTGYQTGQTNAEKVVNITWGDDIQPAINGRYEVVNRGSGKLMDVLLGSKGSGANIWQKVYTVNALSQQWDVTPVDSRVGGDFSYFTFTNVNSAKVPDVLNFSLDNGANIQQWDDTKGTNQQWYLEYAGDGWFYIRNRQSAKCLEVADATAASLPGANIQQWEKDGGTNQQWRFIPIGTPVEFVSPGAPTNLTATANASSVRLDWTASPDTDVTGYTVFRSDSTGGSYSTIARNVTSTSFVDNTTAAGRQYFYTVKAVDKNLNRSGYSNETSATATGSNDLVANLHFDGNTMDSTMNLNHSATYGTITYVAGKIGSQAIALNGTNTFVQLPANIANQKEITIAAWVYWKGGSAWQRIFDFGSDQTKYLFLTPNPGTGQMRFTIKNVGAEQQLNTTILSVGKWTHVAVTLSASAARIYINGVLSTESNAITISPMDFKPILNYIGRSQFSDPLFNGNIDDFRIYNYALPANDVARIAGIVSAVADVESDKGSLTLSPVPANNVLHVSYSAENNNDLSTLTVFNTYGKLVMSKEITSNSDTDLNVSNLPSGIYLLKLNTSKETLMKKFIVNN
jgi:hypothetical protein